MAFSRSSTVRVLAAAIMLSASAASYAQSESSPEWEWMLAPYGWGVSFGTDLRRESPPAGGVSNDTAFDDVLDKFDGAFQVHVEGQTDGWGVFADFTYLGLADEKNFPRFGTESDLDARLFEVAGVWSPGGVRDQGLDVFAGLRYLDVDMTVRFNPVNLRFDSTTFDGSSSFSDLLLGARYTWALSDRWGLTVRGDGSLGDTEGTWNGSAVASYRMRRGAWMFGYRYMSVELRIGSTTTELTMSGPMVGYGFKF